MADQTFVSDDDFGKDWTEDQLRDFYDRKVVAKDRREDDPWPGEEPDDEEEE